MSLMDGKMTKEMPDGFVKDATKGLYVPKGMENVGKAYGFFDCKYEREMVEGELQDIRYVSKIPEEVHLSLTEGTDNIDDAGLLSFVRDRDGEDFRYVLGATHRGATNEDAASELRHVLNQAYQSPLFLSPLHGEEEPFVGDVVYKENGEYVFWD